MLEAIRCTVIPRCALNVRINFSEDELKNVDCLDNSGMDNQDQPIYNSMVLLSTISPSEMEATTIPPSEMEAKTIPPSEMEATTIPPSEVTAKQGRPRERQIRPSITRRYNSRNDWEDLSSWQSDEVGGRAEEKTLYCFLQTVVAFSIPQLSLCQGCGRCIYL